MILPDAEGHVAGNELFKIVFDALAGCTPVLPGNEVPQKGKFRVDSGCENLEGDARMQGDHGHDAWKMKKGLPDFQRGKR